MLSSKAIAKSDAGDFRGRFRETVSDPLNIFIDRVPEAGTMDGDHVIPHNGHKVALRGPNSYYKFLSDILIINRGVREPLEEFVF